MENNTRIDLQAIAPGKMIPLAHTTLDMLFRFLLKAQEYERKRSQGAACEQKQVKPT